MKRFLELLGIFFAIVCVGMSCGKDELNMAWESTGTAADTLTIGLGETLESSNGETLSFERLVEDSRCPANAMCIWQGMVTVDMKATNRKETTMFALSTDPAKPERVTASALGYEVTLLNVFPYPGTVENPDPDDYVVEVIVKRID